MATRALFHEIYAHDNPYSSYDVVPSEIARINGLTVREFHKRYWMPKNASVLLVGDVDHAAATKAIAKAFGEWKGGVPPTQACPPTIPTRRRVVLVSRPKSAQ
jgi:zinc protease